MPDLLDDRAAIARGGCAFDAISGGLAGRSTISWLNAIEATPTLIRYKDGLEVERVMGWDRAAWQRLTGIAGLGDGLPATQPG